MTACTLLAHTEHAFWKVLAPGQQHALVYMLHQDTYVLNACDTAEVMVLGSMSHLWTCMHYSCMPSKGTHLISACFTIV